MTSTSQTSTRHPESTRSAPLPRRATVAGLLGVLGAVMLAGGTGFAYAASTDLETGYLTVVDEGAPSTGVTVDRDCPEDVGQSSFRAYSWDAPDGAPTTASS